MQQLFGLFNDVFKEGQQWQHTINEMKILKFRSRQKDAKGTTHLNRLGTDKKIKSSEV
jgi:hypothetical protein